MTQQQQPHIRPHSCQSAVDVETGAERLRAANTITLPHLTFETPLAEQMQVALSLKALGWCYQFATPSQCGRAIPFEVMKRSQLLLHSELQMRLRKVHNAVMAVVRGQPTEAA